jgi:hypothetical protein
MIITTYSPLHGYSCDSYCLLQRWERVNIIRLICIFNVSERVLPILITDQCVIKGHHDLDKAAAS